MEAMKIPPEELARLRSCVREAWELAELGQVREGYAVLELGLTWAETPPLDPVSGEVGSLEPWSAALAVTYRQELVRYAVAHHGVLGSCFLVRHAQFLRQEAMELRDTSASLCEQSERLARQVEQLAAYPTGGTPRRPKLH
jgi:hypothetical protein